MQQRAEELKAQKGLKGAAKREREFQACIDAIEALEGSDQQIAARFHMIVSEEAPHLNAKTWYGFPSYALDDKVITFVQPSSKFDTRYTSIGFNEDATLDDGPMWATSFAVLEVPTMSMRSCVSSCARPLRASSSRCAEESNGAVERHR